MLACPNCDQRLARRRTPHGLVHACPGCGGRMVSTAVLRKGHASRDFLGRTWDVARSGEAARGRRCPTCAGVMKRVEAPVDAPEGARPRSLELDVCLACACIWFDRGEYAGMPRAPGAGAAADSTVLEPHGLGEAGEPGRGVEVRVRAEDSAPESAAGRGASREEIAAAVLAREKAGARLAERKAEAARGEVLTPVGQPLEAAPIERWKYLPAIFGYPVECGVAGPSMQPWVTWGTAAVSVIVFAASVAMGPEFFNQAGEAWGFKPGEWHRLGGLTILAGFFIHGGLWHLLGNVYFLLVFGDNVEDNLGRGRYAGLILVSHLAGYVAHGLFDGRPDVALVGASAGISGIIAYYAVAFPRAKLAFFFIFIPIRWFRLPAWAVFVLWVLVQAFLARWQMAGVTNVSALAHLGGAAVGLAAALVLRKRRRVSPSGGRLGREAALV